MSAEGKSAPSEICGTCHQPKVRTITVSTVSAGPCPECGWVTVFGPDTRPASERIARTLLADRHVRAYWHYGDVEKLIAAVDRAIAPELMEITRNAEQVGYNKAIDLVATGESA